MNNKLKTKSGYKETKIGLMPDSWNVIKLNQISEITAGGTPSTSIKEYWNGDIPWMNSGELNLRRVYGVEGRITELGLKNSSTKIIPKQSVLIGLAGQGRTRGTVAINEIDLCTNQSVAAIMLDHAKSSYLYLFHYLDSQYDELRKLSTGDGGRGGLNLQILGNLHIPLPPLPEQKKIAEILSTWDRAIEKTEKLIDAKIKLKKGLMQQLLTGRKRFKEFINDQWITVKLGDVFNERNEIEYSELELLSITSTNGVVKRDSINKTDTSNEDKSKYKRICPGDIGYNTMRMWQGVSGVSTFEGIVSPAYTVVIPQDCIDPIFMGYLFKLSEVVHLFHRHSQGLVDDTLNLKYHHFAMIHVNIPENIREQQRIASVLSSIDNEISTLNKKLDVIKQQKKGLMQKLLTGQVRVKV